MEKKSVDRRLFEREVSRGLRKDAEAKAYLASLPDETANAQWVEVELHDAELGEGGEGNNHSGSNP